MVFSTTKALASTLLLGSSFAQAALVEHFWNITYVNANPNGLAERRVIGVNNTWPPPPIFVHQHDQLYVHATNGLGDVGTALHSHGNFFNGSNYYDGAVGTTQCAIPPGRTLSYHIPVDLQQGTYWIHGHFNGQYVDGLRAPVVILPAENRTDGLEWDEDYTLIVSDWYHDEHPKLMREDFLVWWNPTGAEPVPKSAMIYVAKNDGNGSYVGSYADLMNGNATNDNAFIPFTPGKRYRIRVINMSALAMFHLLLEDHEMQVIELDGIEVQPQAVDMLTISVAQRYSIYVEAKNTTDRNYALMALQDPDMYDVIADGTPMNNTITIQYDANLPKPEAITFDEAPTEYSAYPVFNDVGFVPLDVAASAPPDVEIDLMITFDTYSDGTPRAAFNDITYQMPKTPSLFTQLSMGNSSDNARIYGAQTDAIPVKNLQNVQVTLYNTDTGAHPFHLHGHSFQIMAKSTDYTSNDTSINPPIVEKSNPAVRDTITVPPMGSSTIRFRADNPGAWLLHCHVEWHMNQGLAMTFISSSELAQKVLTLPSEMIDHCAYWDIPTTGNIVGLNSTTDFKGEPYGPFPQILGWRPKGIGAMAGCVLTALLGIGSVIWYASGSLEEDEIASEIQRKQEMKSSKPSVFKRLAGGVSGNR